jgi:hypothetical protein
MHTEDSFIEYLSRELIIYQRRQAAIKNDELRLLETKTGVVVDVTAKELARSEQKIVEIEQLLKQLSP